MAAHHEMILILDFGSQYTQLIARRVREARVYCEIVPFNADLSEYAGRNVRGYVLSGGPASLSDPDSPRMDPSFFDTDLPVLGVCYGMQLMAERFGGELVASHSREYGRAQFTALNGEQLFSGIPQQSVAWMSHGGYCP